MASKKRKLQEINASSMADIAFLLLVFFLVTTTMDTDFGIPRKLPPPIEVEEPPQFKERNIFLVLVNANDQLLVENDLLEISQLREEAKIFIENPQNRDDLPEKKRITGALCKTEIQKYKSLAAAEPDNKLLRDNLKKWEKRLNAVNVVGDYWESKQVISLKNDRGTSYDMYITVQDELAQAYHELRDELAMREFNKPFGEGLTKEQFDAVKTVYPQKISEAEPVSYQK